MLPKARQVVQNIRKARKRGSDHEEAEKIRVWTKDL